MVITQTTTVVVYKIRYIVRRRRRRIHNTHKTNAIQCFAHYILSTGI